MSDPSESCPRCRALEARVAELERRLAEGGPPGGPSGPAAPLKFQALRILEHGWGADWGLRPSPVRRQWMAEQPIAYQCLPMVVANQWGWQVLCPTDVRASWDGAADPSLSVAGALAVLREALASDVSLDAVVCYARRRYIDDDPPHFPGEAAMHG